MTTVEKSTNESHLPRAVEIGLRDESRLLDEPLLYQDKKRYSLLPIIYPEIWNFYKKHEGSFWVVEEIDFSKDLAEWDALDDDKRSVLENILAFFSGADAIVNENLAENFSREIDIPEVKCFYGFQIAMENIHNEAYSLMIDVYLRKDKKRREMLLDSINTDKSISKLYDWAIRWLQKKPADDSDLAKIHLIGERLVAFACVEGIMFSGAFCIIYWIREEGILDGFTFANDLIAKDEGLHRDFACHLFKDMIKRKPSKETVINIIKESVDFEIEFIDGIMSKLTGMSNVSMGKYIRFVADSLYSELGYAGQLYGDENPFPFMDKISANSKANQFEKRTANYSRSGFESKHEDDNEVATADDF